MKTLTIIILLALSLQTFGQDELYQSKVESYKHMTHVGTSVAILGFIATACGGYTYTQGINNMRYEPTMEQGTIQYGVGIGTMIIGGSIFLTGAIIGNIGSNNMKKYQKKLDIGILYDKNAKGLILSYKF